MGKKVIDPKAAAAEEQGKQAPPQAPGKEDNKAPPFVQKSEGEDEGDEEQEEIDVEKAKKSVNVTADDLEKSLQKLDSLVQKDDVGSRKEALLSKAQKGGDLSKSERDELFGLLGGEAPKTATVPEEITKGLKENGTLQKALDVSDYLTEQHTELCKSLAVLGEHVQKSDSRQHEFNLVLAKAVADVGGLVKSMAETLGAIAEAPARGPKSAGIAQGAVVQKSFAGAPPAGEQLSKSEILESLDQMMEKSMADGRHGVAGNGEDLLRAISKYEQLSTISPSLLAEVQAFRNRAVTR